MTITTMEYDGYDFKVKYEVVSYNPRAKYEPSTIVKIHSFELEDPIDEEDRDEMDAWLKENDRDIEEHFYEILTDQ